MKVKHGTNIDEVWYELLFIKKKYIYVYKLDYHINFIFFLNLKISYELQNNYWWKKQKNFDDFIQITRVIF